MSGKSSPLRIAAISLMGCLAIDGLVIALFFARGDAQKAHDPIRLAILLFVTIAVPLGNYVGGKWRRRSAE